MTPAQELLAGAAITSFRLNGQFLAVAENLAKPANLTAAWWQVLGAIMAEPLPVSGIARAMGITRQSVQRIADLMVDKGFAEYRDNPAHKRAKLLAITADGLAAVRAIDPGHAVFADRLATAFGTDDLRAAVSAMQRLSAVLETFGDTLEP